MIKTSTTSTRWSVLAGVSIFLILMIVIARLEISRQEALEQRVRNTSRDHAARLEKSMERTLSVTYAMAALVQQYKGNVPEFERAGRTLLPLYPGARAIALLPDGVVTHIVPFKGNESSIGHNIFKDSKRRPEALLALRTGKLTLGGPYPMLQGYEGAIGRYPVFLNDDQGQPYFWGFTGVSVNVVDVVRSAQLRTLEQRGFAYRVWRLPPGQQARQIIASSSAPLLVHPIREAIRLDNATWYIDVAPASGWFNWWIIVLEAIFALIISIMSAALARLFVDAQNHATDLEKIANYDPLTGLPNRRYLDEALHDALIRAREAQSSIALCYLDLDGFKPINDAYGHEAGDFLLETIASRLEQGVRDSDVVARMGGDEFVVVLNRIHDPEMIDEVVQRLNDIIEQPVEYKNQTLSVGTSIGVAIFPEDCDVEDRLLRHADQAMYEAKRRQIKPYVLYSEIAKFNTFGVVEAPEIR